MASTTSTRRASASPPRWIIVAVGVLIVVAIGLAARSTLFAPQAINPSTVAAQVGSLTATVSGIGTVGAAREVDLIFQSSGIVTDVFVSQGDTVVAGQPLARIDDRALQAIVLREQASLDAARARLTQAERGNAGANDIAAAKAQLDSAQANYAKTAAGASAADIASAQAQVESAQANYAKIAAGPSAADIASAEAALRNAIAQQNSILEGATASDQVAAQASVRSAESQLAQAQQVLAETRARPKPEDIRAAEIALEQAKNALWSQQLSRDAMCGRVGADAGDCRSADASVGAQEMAVRSAADKLELARRPATAEEMAAAEESVRSAEAGLTSAKTKLAQVQAGPTAADRQAAQTQVDQARASLDKLRTSVTADDLSVARASIDQARANLDKVRTSVTADDVAVAQASVDQARANLAKLSASATDTDLIVQLASVTQAEQSLVQVRLNLENATLKAPFDGVIAALNVVPGSTVGGVAAVGRLVNRGTPHIDLKLSENDVLKVALEQPVILTNDALRGWSAPGKVSYIAPAAETTSGVTTYQVRATFDDADQRLRVGMTANVDITTAQKDGILLVPSTALLPKGAGHIVQQIAPDGQGVVDVDVKIGISDGIQTEIVSGLNEGDQVVAFPTVSAPRPSGGFFGG
jgi:HlyD family secretion protein